MLSNINVENSESFNSDDKTRIFKSVKSIDGGFSALNSMVIGKMRDWVLVAIDRSIEESKSKIRTQRESVDLVETMGSTLKDEIKKSRLVIWDRLLAKMSMTIDMGKFKEAKEIGEECEVEFADIEERKYLSRTHNNLGKVSNKLGEHEKAIEYYDKALQIYWADNLNVATSYLGLGNAYSSKKLKEYQKAITYYENALQIQKTQLGKFHVDVAMSYNSLGNVYNKQEKYQKAITHYKLALEIRKYQLGSDHVDVAICYINLGNVYNKQGEHQEAITYYENALHIQKDQLGEDHVDVATSYNNLGAVYDKLGEYQKAITYYENALQIRKDQLGEDHQSTKDTINNMRIAKSKL